MHTAVGRAGRRTRATSYKESDVGVYYYSPFERTDDDERQTWNLCLSWGGEICEL
jgi:hypothetical protein